MDLRRHLSDPSLLVERARIGDRWLASDAMIVVDDPATGAAIGSIPNLGGAETEEAIAAADRAFTSWRRNTAAERAGLLMAWHRAILNNIDDLAAIMTAEQGKPLPEAKGEVLYSASFVEWFAAEAVRTYGQVIPSPNGSTRIITLKQPVGVVAAITPWNFPSAMITRKVAPALAAGCTVVLKPSEITPFSALALAALAERAGIPPGVLNIVTGSPKPIGNALCASSTVRKLSFTGSTAVGKLLYEACAKTVKRLSLELGGNAPFLVFDDADLDAAVDGLVANKFRNAGQTCICANRGYVQARVYDLFARKLADRVAGLTVGNGCDAGVDVGPLVNAASHAKVRRHLEDAVGKGARVLTGGAPARDGLFFRPTVLADAHDAMQVASEETFGPIVPLFRFEWDDEALERANATPFGLAAYVYARDVGRILRVGEALEAGMVGINSGTISTTVAPFGGIKESGLGREGAREGLDEYLETKALHLGGLNL